MNQVSEKTEEFKAKFTPLMTTRNYDWAKVEEFTDREIEISKLIFLRKIDKETTRAAKNITIILQIIVVSLFISLIAFVALLEKM